jgi:L-lactate dehydrogenase
MSNVAVIGAGHVGAAVANALVLLRTCDVVVLYDRDVARAEGEAWDIADAIPLLAEMEIRPAGDLADLRGSDVVVITIGATVTPGGSRLDLLGANAELVAGVMRELDGVCPEAVVVLVSNPVDVLTRVALEASNRPAGRVVGCGTVLDGARLRQRLGRVLGVEREDVHAYVVGEHGDSSFPVWSSATVGATPLRDVELPDGVSLSQIEDEAAAATRVRGRRIHERKGFTSYGVAAAVARIVRAVVRDERRLFMVSVEAPERYGLGSVVLSLPSVIGAGGVGRHLRLSLSADERALLERSAAILESAYRSVRLEAPR